MIQLANNIATNTSAPAKPGGPIIHELKAWSISTQSTPAEEKSGDKNNLFRKEIINLALMEAGNNNSAEKGYGNAQTMQEFDELTTRLSLEDKEYLSQHFTPSKVYSIILTRIAEQAQGKNVVSTKEMITGLKDVLKSRFKLDEKSELFRMYTNLFDKAEAFANSGILKHPQAKDILTTLEKIDSPNEYESSFDAFQKSIASP